MLTISVFPLTTPFSCAMQSKSILGLISFYPTSGEMIRITVICFLCTLQNSDLCGSWLVIFSKHLAFRPTHCYWQLELTQNTNVGRLWVTSSKCCLWMVVTISKNILFRIIQNKKHSSNPMWVTLTVKMHNIVFICYAHTQHIFVTVIYLIQEYFYEVLPWVAHHTVKQYYTRALNPHQKLIVHITGHCHKCMIYEDKALVIYSLLTGGQIGTCCNK